MTIGRCAASTGARVYVAPREISGNINVSSWEGVKIYGSYNVYSAVAISIVLSSVVGNVSDDRQIIYAHVTGRSARRESSVATAISNVVCEDNVMNGMAEIRGICFETL